MNLDSFPVFAAVAKHGNVTRAASDLAISQPAVTKHLRLLEENYKTKLYTRGGTGIELTPAGQLFLREVKAILSRVEALRAKLGSASAMEGESLTVGGSYSPSASLLPSLLARFKKTRPEADLRLRTNSRAIIERFVLNGEADLAVLNDPPLNRHLAIEPYRKEPLVAFVHPHHFLARKPHLDWQGLRRVGFVIRRREGGIGTADRYLQNLGKNGVRTKVLMRCDSPEAVKAAVKRNMGVGILYREVVADSLKRGEFKAIKLPGEPLAGESSIVYHKTRPLSLIAQDFLKLLRAQRPNPKSD